MYGILRGDYVLRTANTVRTKNAARKIRGAISSLNSVQRPSHLTIWRNGSKSVLD